MKRERRNPIGVCMVVLVVLLAPSFLPAPSAVAQGDTPLQEPPPMFRASASRTGAVPGNVTTNGTFMWSHATDSEVYSSPVVDDGRVYVGTMGGEVLCLNAYTGSVVWNRSTGMPVESSPAVADGRVYIGSDDGRLHCLDAGDGSLAWSHRTGGEIKSSPAVVDGRVYFGSNDFGVHCLDAADGQELWNYSTEGWVYSSPAVVGDRVYFGSCDGLVYCINATSGDLVWTFEAEYAPASPAVTDELVIIGTYDDHLYYLDRGTGEELMNVSGFRSGVYSSAAVYGRIPDELGWNFPIVVIGDNNGTLRAIGGDGEVFFERHFDGGITSSPVLATGMSEWDPFVVVGTEAGVLLGWEVYNPHAGPGGQRPQPRRWSVDLGLTIKSSPFLYHERVYVGVATDDGGGRVVCVGSPYPHNEVWVDLLDQGYPPDGSWYDLEGRVDVYSSVRGIPLDEVTVEVEFGGLVKTATYNASHRFWLASFDAVPPEGLHPVTVRAIHRGEVVAVDTGEVMSLVEGWDSLDIVIESPEDGSRVGDIVRIRGTATTNYSVEWLHVQWDDREDYFASILHSGRYDGHRWNVTFDTVDLEPGRHTLTVVGLDGYRRGTASVVVHVGDEEEDAEDVGLLDVAAVVVLIAIFAALLLRRPREGSVG